MWYFLWVILNLAVAAGCIALAYFNVRVPVGLKSSMGDTPASVLTALTIAFLGLIVLITIGMGIAATLFFFVTFVALAYKFLSAPTASPTG